MKRTAFAAGAQAMSDPVNTGTEATTRSWGGRLVAGLLGLVLGPLLVLGSCIGLFWNEGRAVQTARSLSEGAGLVVDVKPSPVTLANDGLLVHVTGDLKATAKLSDPDFAVTADAVRLVRDVAMYQWKEESKTENRRTVYKYQKEWSGRPIDSSRFQESGLHENPPMQIARRDFVSDDATLGAFRLGPQAIRSFNTDTKLEVDPSVTEAVRNKFGRPVNIAVGQIYLSENPGSPRIGDYRIGFRVVPTGTGSVVARQSGAELTGYPTTAGDVILLAHTGTQSAAEMFKDAQDQNRLLTWILRGVLAMTMLIGFVLSTSVLVAIAEMLPVIGDLIRYTTFAAGLLLTVILAPLTIAMAWLFYRPAIALGIVAGGAALVYGLSRLIAARGKPMPAAIAPGRAQ